MTCVGFRGLYAYIIGYGHFFKEWSVFGRKSQKSIWGPLVIIKSGMDITDNIPDMFLASGAPTAPPRTDPASPRAPLAPPERPPASHAGWAS